MILKGWRARQGGITWLTSSRVSNNLANYYDPKQMKNGLEQAAIR